MCNGEREQFGSTVGGGSVGKHDDTSFIKVYKEQFGTIRI